jgi:hypothetical protein
MKYKGLLSFEVEDDLLDPIAHPIKDIRELHRLLNKIYHKTYPVYIYDLLSDINDTLTIYDKRQTYGLKNGEMIGNEAHSEIKIIEKAFTMKKPRTKQ